MSRKPSVVPSPSIGGDSTQNIGTACKRAIQERMCDKLQVIIDRATEESAGRFGSRIRDLLPDCVIDLTSYTLEGTSSSETAHLNTRLM